MTMGRMPVGFAGIAGRQTPTHGGGASGKESEDSMAIAILTENLAVHQSMADEPNGDDGLTAGELKAKFDQAALAIQKYLNETVVPAVNAAGGGVRTVNGLAPGPDGNVNVATEEGVSQAYVDGAVQEVREASLPKAGGQVTGDLGISGGLNLGGCALTGAAGTLTLGGAAGTRLQNLAPPELGSDGVNRDYVDRGWSLPAWWDTALEEAAAKVRALQDEAGAGCIGFVFFTDCHWGSNAGRTGQLAAALLDRCQLSWALCGGDLVRSGVAATKAEMEADFSAVQVALRPLRGRLLTALGNHVGSWGQANGKPYAFNFTPEALYSRLLRQCPCTGRGADGSYYYLDDPGAKVRFLVLNSVWCPYGEDEVGAALYPRQNNYGFGQEQLTWVANVGLRFTEPGWALVVVTHVPVHTDCEGQFRDRALLTGMLNAFVKGKTYQGVYEGSGEGSGGAIAPGFTNLADPASTDWKMNCRVSSSGVETVAAGVTTTNFIPACQGQTLHIRGLDFQSAAPNGEFYGRIHFYDENQSFLAQINPNAFPQAVVVADYDEQVWTYQLTVSNSGEQMTQYGNLAYVRVTGLTPETGGDVAITLDEEIRFQSTKPWDYASVDVDFTQAVRAEVVGCFCGHLHRDVLAQVDQVQVAVTTCDGNLAYDTAEDPRTPGTDGEQVLDIVTVNRRDRSVHLTRVGPGTDRSFSY